MTATKEQEREALAKVKNIVEEVGGADSYIGMAFEGCFELAEENINEDGGYSWQSKYQSVCEELNTVKAELEQSRLEVARQHDRATTAERELHVSCIRDYDLQAIRFFITQQQGAEQSKIASATDDLVANIERQDSYEYTHACETIKEAKRKLSQYKKLLSNLAEIKGVKTGGDTNHVNA